ncbi:flagellar basal body-associated FliL family protein [Microbaculum marinisediminis]|uniref:Flagellar protein FliL n=1 Tax=Microbaculum marinisediminis TaxID=2931392 RepID=A0AAW5QYM4_9HYPH|nr:flagellar basal body-associated FliL family protein [Microbaculum sp. A6E488]MCT8972828.1 flagellar basal body-associated FliL family protein [Microbaculum sp. A6E488]
MSTEVAQPDFDNIEATPDSASQDGAPKGRRKLVIIGAAAVLGVALLGGGGYLFLGSGGGSGTVQQEPPVFFELPEMTVNLSSVDQRPQFLRVQIALEMKDRETKEAVEQVLPRVLDAFQVYLRELRSTDLQGSAGIYRLKEELVRRVNLAIHPAEIDNVVFKEIIVQ